MRLRDQLLSLTLEHLELVLVAIAVAAALAIPGAILLTRRAGLRRGMVGFANIVQTVPSLALFGFLVPITHLGFRTAEIGLISYTLLILVRNIVTSIDGVPAAVKEAADGMGYTPLRRFFAVDLRLATPGIVAGVRIASESFFTIPCATANSAGCWPKSHLPESSSA